MYPIGHFLKYQHVFYNAVDRAWNRVYDLREQNAPIGKIDSATDWAYKVEDLLDKFNRNPQDKNGIVYVLYEDYKVMKDIIGGYAYRHGGTV